MEKDVFGLKGKLIFSSEMRTERIVFCCKLIKFLIINEVYENWKYLKMLKPAFNIINTEFM